MFKDNLKFLREKQNISKQKMAELLGVPYATYNSYENRGSEPAYSILKKAANVLAVSIDTLLADELPNTSSQNMLSMKELPPADTKCFTPYYAFSKETDNKIWLMLWKCLEINELENCHEHALNRAKETYRAMLMGSIMHCISPLRDEIIDEYFNEKNGTNFGNDPHFKFTDTPPNENKD